MEESEKRVLSQFRGRLANEIVVTASFLSAFCERSVLDEEMTKIVKSEDNYVAKAHKLMELLPKRGPKAFSTLLEILEITNPWLAEKMKSALHEERNREAKLKISSSVSESASIEGYGAASRQTIDNDLRATARRFVKSSLQHLTDSEQRSTEQWLGEELQRERRKQQFRTPHTIRRHPQEFLSSKEVQTEMKGMELQELCEDLMVQLHGVQYVEMNTDLSFNMLQTQISELLSRVHKMDFLFIQCLEKFDDVDKYALALPDLIERSMMRQKELVRALMDDRRKIQRLTEDRDSLDRHIRRLEEDFERLLKTPSQKAIHPQQMYLKKRKELQERYTLTKPADSKSRKPSTASHARVHGGKSSAIASHRNSSTSSEVPPHGVNHHGEASTEHHGEHQTHNHHAESSELNPGEDKTSESHTDESVDADSKPAPSSPKQRVRFTTPASRPVTGSPGQTRKRPGTSQVNRSGQRGTSGRLSITSGRK
ncbi:hypothetical protein BaRGS_00021410 [Batillaria attramentaria]|uniref:CARD domain-containing protein n=1 Tax=Batillaria attramentaria TaxID=370345 RepID=A0ABD0KJP1_9CAEN